MTSIRTWTSCEDCEHRWWHAPGETWRGAICLWCGALYVVWHEAVKDGRGGAMSSRQEGTG